MTSKLDTAVGDRRRQRRFLIEFGVAIGVYVVVVFAVVAAAGLVPAGPARAALAVLPMVPVAAIAVVTVRHLRRLDERERARMLEGLAVGFVFAMLAAVLCGLLDAFGLGIPFSAWWIYAIGMLAWVIAAAVGKSR